MLNSEHFKSIFSSDSVYLVLLSSTAQHPYSVIEWPNCTFLSIILLDHLILIVSIIFIILLLSTSLQPLSIVRIAPRSIYFSTELCSRSFLKVLCSICIWPSGFAVWFCSRRLRWERTVSHWLNWSSLLIFSALPFFVRWDLWVMFPLIFLHPIITIMSPQGPCTASYEFWCLHQFFDWWKFPFPRIRREILWQPH